MPQFMDKPEPAPAGIKEEPKNPAESFQRLMDSKEKARLTQEFHGIQAKVDAAKNSADPALKTIANNAQSLLDGVNSSLTDLTPDEMKKSLNSVYKILDQAPHFLRSSISDSAHRIDLWGDTFSATCHGDIRRACDGLLDQYRSLLDPEIQMQLKKDSEVAGEAIDEVVHDLKQQTSGLVQESVQAGDNLPVLQKVAQKLAAIADKIDENFLSRIVKSFETHARATVAVEAAKQDPQQFVGVAAWNAKRDLPPELRKQATPTIDALVEAALVTIGKNGGGKKAEKANALVLAKFQDDLHGIVQPPEDIAGVTPDPELKNITSASAAEAMLGGRKNSRRDKIAAVPRRGGIVI